jgi:sugar phosphate isomerase/epimerase
MYSTTGPIRSLTWDEAAERFVEAIAPVAEHARSVGVRLAIENTTTMRADLGFVHLLRDAVELARSARIAVCADLFVAWTDRDLRQELLLGVETFAMVQVADFVLGTMSTPNRAVPGDGDVPIARHLRWLTEAGYRGPVELELLGPRIEAEGPAAAAARALPVIAALLSEPSA